MTSPTVSNPASTRSVSTTAMRRARSSRSRRSSGMPSSRTVPASGGCVADQRAQQGRLAGAVRADAPRRARRAGRSVSVVDRPRSAIGARRRPRADSRPTRPRARPERRSRRDDLRVRERRVSTQITTGTPRIAVTALSGSTPRCPGGWATTSATSAMTTPISGRRRQQDAVVGRPDQRSGQVRGGDADERRSAR